MDKEALRLHVVIIEMSMTAIVENIQIVCMMASSVRRITIQYKVMDVVETMSTSLEGEI